MTVEGADKMVRWAEDGSRRSASPAVRRRAPPEGVPVMGGAKEGRWRGGLRYRSIMWSVAREAMAHGPEGVLEECLRGRRL